MMMSACNVYVVKKCVKRGFWAFWQLRKKELMEVRLLITKSCVHANASPHMLCHSLYTSEKEVCFAFLRIALPRN